VSKRVFTATGRELKPPEFQKLPPRTEEGRELQEAIRPLPPSPLLDIDYSSLELRITAQLGLPKEYVTGKK
jgi:DNA polymerase I-like protein with 3'-5' exonuclease and polymerase domains